ncbi:hypothetical protein C4D60_Mb04t12270 [Musa balbisiana]|uniref:Uncharacterized protein n=1 Tax=Musa balbisiana TaxID=52838 RepID=A0A4S8KBG0_MUSBA|nr:hypothetical protein C4D60_Mb04t12270 [Musa balbisiana]
MTPKTPCNICRKSWQNSLPSNLEEGTPIEFQGGRSPKEIKPKLRICKGSNTWYQSSVLGISLHFHSHPSSLHSRPKQFPQLLKRSSLNFAIISTTPTASPCRVGRKKCRQKGSEVVARLPTITLLLKCRLRILKVECVKDYLLMEEEFAAKQ